MITNVLRNLTKIYQHFRDYRWHFVLISVLSLIYSLLAGVGIAAFIPVFKLSRTKDPEEFSRIGKAFSSAFQYAGVEASLTNIFLLIIGFLLLRFVAYTGYQVVIQYTISDYKKTMIDRLTERLFKTRWEYFQNQHRGSLLDYMTTRIMQVRGLLRIITKLLVSYTVALGYLITAFWISSKLTILAVLMFIITVSIMIPLAGKTKEISEISMVSQNQISRFLDEFMNAFREIKIYNIFADVRNKIESQTRENANAEFKVGLMQNISHEAFMVLIGIALLGGIFFSISQTGVGFEQLGPFGFLFLLIFQRINKLDKVQQIAEYSPSINVLEDLSKELNRNVEQTDRLEKKASDRFAFQQQITFDNVSFSYHNQGGSNETEALSSINLNIPHGSMTAFVGRSGAGKSTLIGLLLGLLKPTGGKILVDGINLQDIGLKHWRQMISYVPQEPFLLNDTIHENIRFFRNIPGPKIHEASRKSNAHEFVKNTPQGYDTVIGEEGVKLSGGQRQRLVFARAIAAEPEVLILDEPTSELDTISEKHIRDSLHELRDRMTIISVSHQLSTIVDADSIIVLDDGTVVEQGSREELERNEGHFYKLQQFS